MDRDRSTVCSFSLGEFQCYLMLNDTQIEILSVLFHVENESVAIAYWFRTEVYIPGAGITFKGIAILVDSREGDAVLVCKCKDSIFGPEVDVKGCTCIRKSDTDHAFKHIDFRRGLAGQRVFPDSCDDIVGIGDT